MNWNDAAACMVDNDGRRLGLRTVTSKVQAERWLAAGYDYRAAFDRFYAFKADWLDASETKARSEVLSFFNRERELAIQQGIPSNDPDIWRFDAAPKHFL